MKLQIPFLYPNYKRHTFRLRVLTLSPTESSNPQRETSCPLLKGSVVASPPVLLCVSFCSVCVCICLSLSVSLTRRYLRPTLWDSHNGMEHSLPFQETLSFEWGKICHLGCLGHAFLGRESNWCLPLNNNNLLSNTCFLLFSVLAYSSLVRELGADFRDICCPRPSCSGLGLVESNTFDESLLSMPRWPCRGWWRGASLSVCPGPLPGLEMAW